MMTRVEWICKDVTSVFEAVATLKDVQGREKAAKISWAVVPTHRSAFLSATVQLPNQTHMQKVSKPSVEQQSKDVGGEVVHPQDPQEIKSLL